MSQAWMPQIDPNVCTGCAQCVVACPTHALGSRQGKAVLLHPEACTYCSVCEDVCPVGAIELPYLILKKEAAKENSNE